MRWGTVGRARRVMAAACVAIACGASGAVAQADVNEGPARAQLQGAITAGENQTCAVDDDGLVRCWGDDADGQLGDGTIATPENNGAPRPAVALGAPARAVSAGAGFSCALLAGGTVRCWGRDAFDQLGDGDATGTTKPAPAAAVALGQAATAVSAGSSHACALLVDGSVRCWGYDQFAQLGDGTVGTPSIPRAVGPPVALGQRVTAIAAGDVSTCALLADGAVRCWGYDADGQLGDGDMTGTTKAAPSSPVALGRPAIAIAAGTNHTCALLDDGAVRCWGSDVFGQLGDGTFAAPAANPAPATAVPLGGPARGIAAGVGHTCALLANGTVRCWGNDGAEQLGDHTMVNSATPIAPIAFGQPVHALTSGWSHTCAVLADGTMHCWGANGNGELGNGVAAAALAAPFSTAPLPAFGGVTVGDLSLTAAAAPATRTVGETATLTYTLANSGPDTATATVAAPPAGGLSLSSASVSAGTFNASTALWRVTLAPGASATLTLNTIVVSAGTLVSVAEVVDSDAADPDSTPADDVDGQDDRASATITAAAAATPGGGTGGPGGTPGGGGGGGGAGATATPVAPDRLALRVTRRRDARAPFVFSPVATLVVTRAALASACTGTVTFALKAGRTAVLTQRAPLRLRDGVCTARSRLSIRTRARARNARRLALTAAFTGNAALTGATARAVTVRIS